MNELGRGATQERVKTILIYAFALVLCLFVSVVIGSKSLVLDEAFSVLLIRKDVAGVILGTANDVHPPLFYLMLKVIREIWGENLLAYRIFTAIPIYITLIYVGATWVRRRFGDLTALVFMAWFATCLHTVEAAGFIRMYSWGVLFVGMAGTFLYDLYYALIGASDVKTDIKLAIPAVLLTSCAMYTHFYGILAMVSSWAVLMVAVLLHKNRGRNALFILGCGAAIILLYVPWMRSLYIQTQNSLVSFSVNTFDIREAIWAPSKLIHVSEDGYGLALWCMLIMIYIVAVMTGRWKAVAMSSILVGTMILGMIISVAIRPIFYWRYVYLAWMPAALGLALMVNELRGYLRYVGIISLTLVLGISGWMTYNEVVHSDEVDNTAGLWMEFCEARIADEDIVIIDDSSEHIIVYRYYLPSNELVVADRILSDGLEAYLDRDRRIWIVSNDRMSVLNLEEIEAELKELQIDLIYEEYYTLQYKGLHIYSLYSEG